LCGIKRRCFGYLSTQTPKDLEAQLTDANRKFNSLLDKLPDILPEGQSGNAEELRKNIPGLRRLIYEIGDPGTVALYTLVTDRKETGAMARSCSKMTRACFKNAS